MTRLTFLILISVVGSLPFAGCGRERFQTGVLDTGLPPGNAREVALSPGERFVAVTNPADRSVTVFLVATEADGILLSDFDEFSQARVGLAESGVPVALRWSEGAEGGEVLHVLAEDASGDGSHSVRRIHVSGGGWRREHLLSIGLDEEEPAGERLEAMFADPDDGARLTDDERLRIREEVRRLDFDQNPLGPDSADLGAGVSWSCGERRLACIALPAADHVGLFDVTVRGQADLRALIPVSEPTGLAISGHSGVLFVSSQGSARVLAIDLSHFCRN